jgi:hypothetical protein
MANKKTERAVMVTTAHKGVFFGYAIETGGETITLRAARMAVYWPADLRGVLGLASAGPSRGSKISGAVPEMELRQITAVVECSPEAVANWEKGIWG